MRGPTAKEHAVRVPIERNTSLDGDLAIPESAIGVVLFAHGSGSSRHSPRNRQVAAELQDARMATLLMDLLTPEEERLEAATGHLRFDIELLAGRLTRATHWLGEQDNVASLPVGYFGASTGAAAALVAAAEIGDRVAAVVSRGGRPDLASDALAEVRAPTLLIVGGDDVPVIGMNEEAMAQMRSPVDLQIVPGASHLFEEPGALEEVSRLAREWFKAHFTPD